MNINKLARYRVGLLTCYKFFDSLETLCKNQTAPIQEFVTDQQPHIVQGDPSCCAKPPVDFKTKVPLWPGQDKAELLF